MNSQLMKAILAMDSYNRGYGENVITTETTIGNATISYDSFSLGTIVINGEDVRRDERVSFYAIAYDYDSNADGITDETIISFRGTDDVVNDVLNGYYAYVFCPKRFACSSP